MTNQPPTACLEAVSVDFWLRRFSEYLVGCPKTARIVTDHKPLATIFDRNRKGLICAQRIKLQHQGIPYSVEYRKGKLNFADYLTRLAKPFTKVFKEEQKESEELNNLLYTLHTTPIMDHIGLSTIATKTEEDSVLQKICKYEYFHKSFPNGLSLAMEFC